MKRHILGLALFSSIVASAIFVSWLFYNAPAPAVAPVGQEEVVFSKSKTNCWKDAPKANAGGVSRVKVVQAVFNQRTNQLETELQVDGKIPAGAWVGVNLHFFEKEAGGTRYLTSESLSVLTESDSEKTAAHSVISSFEWLDRLDSRENLYVVAERVGGFGRKVEPSGFDAANARPVLLINGK